MNAYAAVIQQNPATTIRRSELRASHRARGRRESGVWVGSRLKCNVKVVRL